MSQVPYVLLQSGVGEDHKPGNHENSRTPSVFDSSFLESHSYHVIRKLVLLSQQAQEKAGSVDKTSVYVQIYNAAVGVCMQLLEYKSMCNTLGHIILFLYSGNLGEASS